MALAVPVLAWAFLNKIWVGRFFLGGDNTDFFYWIIYYFKNILHGVYPLWNPFKSWGCLEYMDTQDLGIGNPFAQVIPILLSGGVSAYWAYALYLVLCWVIGFLGFFFLLQRIYREPRIAWLGTSLLMFTSGLAVFFSWELQGLYIFAPLGWFFGFLIGWVRSTDDRSVRKNLLGLTFSSMFIAHLYLPFYFLTFFLAFMTSVLMFAAGWFILFINAIKRTFKSMPGLTLFCIASLFLSLWPTWDCYLKLKDPQNITTFARGENEGKTGNPIVVSQDMIDTGGLPCRATFSEMSSSFETGEDYLSYAPIMLFILALLTLWNRSSRTQRVIFMTGFLLLLVTITNACPLQHFLYQHVYIFRLFRNYYFFWILFWACSFVFVMGEIKQFLEWEPVAARDRARYMFWVVLIHMSIIFYLMSLEDVPMVSYATVIASCLWFLARLRQAVHNRPNLFIVGLVFIGLWQPFYVLPFIRGVNHSQTDYVPSGGSFSYVRPLFGSGYNEENSFVRRKKYFQDESGFVEGGYIGQKFSYLLTNNLSREALQPYVRYKFILYNRTQMMDVDHMDWEKVHRVFAFEEPAALVDEASGLFSSEGTAVPVIVKGATADFKVVGFNVNAIEVSIHLDQRKFLVYNDSFHPGWHVSIDRHPVKLYRANIAFKGVWVDKGDHRVKFYFGSWIDHLRGWGVPALFMFWLFLVVAAFLPKKYDELS